MDSCVAWVDGGCAAEACSSRQWKVLDGEAWTDAPLVTIVTGPEALRQGAECAADEAIAVALDNARAVPLLISGAKISDVNGVFEPTQEKGFDGRVLYRKRGDGSMWMEHFETRWMVKSVSSKGTGRCCAWVDGGCAAEACSARPWRVLEDGAWADAPLVTIVAEAETPEAKSTAAAEAKSRFLEMQAAQEQATIDSATSSIAELETRVHAASCAEDCMARLAQFSDLKNCLAMHPSTEDFEQKAATLMQIKEFRAKGLTDFAFSRRESLAVLCHTQILADMFSTFQTDEKSYTAEIAASTNRIAALRKQLQEEEEHLQTTTRHLEIVKYSLSKVEEKQHSTLKDMLQKEEASQQDVLSSIESTLQRSLTVIFDSVVAHNRLKKQVEDLERIARDECATWQCDVCAKSEDEISRSDMVLLFRAVGLTAEHERALLAHDVDGSVFVGVSLATIEKKLNVRTVKHRLLLQHVAESIKNRTLQSLFTASGPDNPLSWSTEQVLQWLQREDLGVLREAVAREHINGIAILQINDDSISSLLNVDIPSLRTLKVINSKLQALQASTIGIIRSTFCSVRPDIRNRIVAGLARALDGSDPVDVPMELLCEWTDNFSPSAKIGSGTFGEVFRARFSNSDRSSCGIVAVKRINPTLNLSSREQQRSEAITALKREICILRTFRHPGIIRLLGYSLPADGLSARSLSSANACLVYELGTRGTLHALLSDSISAVQLSWERRLRLALDIACALNYMHRREPSNPAYHRDVKSSNIVVNESWHAKLIDCGLAKYIPSQEIPGLASFVCETNAGHKFGTIEYMCPEYCCGFAPYDQKSEIYSFGIVLAELLTGKLQQPPDVILHRHLERFPADISAGEWPIAVSECLRELALQCMAEKANRPDSMAIIVKRLGPLVSEHCPQTALEISVQNELLSLYRKQQHQVVADALKQREAAAIAKERSQRQRRTCSACGDEDQYADCVIQCSNKECHSHFCVECFQRDLRVQCGHEDRSKFVKNHCSIVCCICRSSAFSERDVLAFVDDATFAIFRQACADVVEVQAYNKAKSEFRVKVEEMKNELIRVQGAAAQRIHRHRLHICENILTLKCPRRDCRAAIFDFDGCFAVSCTCGCAFCAWCMADCGSDAHAHVKRCTHSANPGSFFGSVDDFDRIHRERRRDAVQRYLAELPTEEAAKVRGAIAADLAHLGIKLRGSNSPSSLCQLPSPADFDDLIFT